MNDLAKAFADLEEDFWKTGSPAPERPARSPMFTVESPYEGSEPTSKTHLEEGPYREKCGKCRGTGVWMSFSGMSSGRCFKCKGKGYRAFKTPPEAREKNRARAAEKRASDAAANRAAAEAFLANNPDIAAWFQSNPNFEFAVSLREWLYKHGSLTEGQYASAKKCANREKPAEKPASGLDLSEVPSGLYAVPGGDTRLKVKIDNVESGKWEGWIFVKDGAEYGSGERYGSQKPRSTYSGKILDALTAIAADPFEASKAYGKLVGRCGVCNRKLEDEKSVAAGIGPICARKF